MKDHGVHFYGSVQKLFLALGFVFAVTGTGLRADEQGLSTCGKPVVVRGEIQHYKLPSGVLVEGATEPDMYEEEVAGTQFSVWVEGLPEGSYEVEVYLAEVYHNDAGRRVFSVFFGSNALANDLDIFAQVGKNREYLLRGEAVHQGDAINGPLELRFESRVNKAKFNAIVFRSNGEVVACVKAKDLTELSTVYPIPEIAEPAVYTNSALPVEQRVADLIRRMSISEKVSQLMNNAPEIQRLGVPAYDYWNECLHGVARAGQATVFPQAIGLAAMWDTNLLHTIADTIATEGRAKNNAARAANPNTARYYGLTFWTPNINIFRDPRWGRGQETYGEDPYLAGELGVAFITGLQGNDPRYYKALACAKHFAVHSGPEKLRHTFNAVPSPRDLYETYLPQFEAAVKRGRVGNVMSAYNALYGVPAPASKFLLTDLLRTQWGFDGHVVSDCGGIHDVWARHNYTSNAATASAVSIQAGNDLECGGTFAALTKAFDQGLVSEADLDRALSRVLTARFRLGLFDSPEDCAYLNIPATENDTPAHSQLALEAARQSMVLLKNNGILPLDRRKIKRIAVIGPNADSKNALRGNYHGDASHPVTVLAGLRNEAGADIEILTTNGCTLALPPDVSYDVTQNAEAQNAIELARRADVVLFIGGLDAGLEGEEMPTSYQGFDRGDRLDIELPRPQRDLLRELAATGRPVVLVNLSGSAMALTWEDENLAAIVQAWYPGQNGGTAVADVLFGKTNPAGRLPVTFYRSAGDLPDFADYSMTNRTYRYFGGKPLYPFGHGLSYTQFEYSTLQASSETVSKDGRVTLSVRIKNAGLRDGEEVAQLYVRHLDSPVFQPRHSLAGFKRVALQAGKSAVVQFELHVAALRYWDERENGYVVPSGAFEVQVGGSSSDIREVLRLKVL